MMMLVAKFNTRSYRFYLNFISLLNIVLLIMLRKLFPMWGMILAFPNSTSTNKASITRSSSKTSKIFLITSQLNSSFLLALNFLTQTS